MILITDGGSTKADWIALNNQKEEAFRVRTLGLNPAVLSKKELKNRISSAFQLMDVKEKVNEVYFYGAGCGTSKPAEILKNVMQEIFTNAKVVIAEDMLGAVYAVSAKKSALVCILGTGSNSCYFDCEKMYIKASSLGYTVMDEASGNYFGKRLLRDYYYKVMPKNIREKFEIAYDLDVDIVKFNLYRKSNPNMYLASFAKFMFDFKDEEYIKKMIKKGFQKFFKYRILSYNTSREIPIYFIGSIAHYFKDILEKVAKKNKLKITGIVQRPIDKLIEFHKKTSINIC